MYIDYVRIYQEEGEESVTCDPREFVPRGIFFFAIVWHIVLMTISSVSRVPDY